MGPPRSRGMEAVLWLPAKQQVQGPQPPPPGACFMQIPASESLLFLSPLTQGTNSGHIWRNGQIHVLVTGWAWSVGVTSGILVLSGEATLLHSSGVISCACSELRWNYHEEIETNF